MSHGGHMIILATVFFQILDTQVVTSFGLKRGGQVNNLLSVFFILHSVLPQFIKFHPVTLICIKKK